MGWVPGLPSRGVQAQRARAWGKPALGPGASAARWALLPGLERSPNPLLLQDVEPLGPLDDLQDGLHLGGAEALALPLLLRLVGVHRPACLQPRERATRALRPPPCKPQHPCRAHRAPEDSLGKAQLLQQGQRAQGTGGPGSKCRLGHPPAPGPRNHHHLSSAGIGAGSEPAVPMKATASTRFGGRSAEGDQEKNENLGLSQSRK